MKTYLNSSLIAMIVGLIVDRNEMSEQEAINSFYLSEISRKLDNENILLRQMSPYLIYELWNAEITIGNYQQSPYANALR
jgi:hypothetical protein